MREKFIKAKTTFNSTTLNLNRFLLFLNLNDMTFIYLPWYLCIISFYFALFIGLCKLLVVYFEIFFNSSSEHVGRYLPPSASFLRHRVKWSSEVLCSGERRGRRDLELPQLQLLQLLHLNDGGQSPGVSPVHGEWQAGVSIWEVLVRSTIVFLTKKEKFLPVFDGGRPKQPPIQNVLEHLLIV